MKLNMIRCYKILCVCWFILGVAETAYLAVVFITTGRWDLWGLIMILLSLIGYIINKRDLIKLKSEEK